MLDGFLKWGTYFPNSGVICFQRENDENQVDLKASYFQKKKQTMDPQPDQ